MITKLKDLLQDVYWYFDDKLDDLIYDYPDAPLYISIIALLVSILALAARF